MKLVASALLTVAAVAAAAVIVMQRRDYTWDLADAAAPDKALVAFARGHNCDAGPCQSLWIGASRETAIRVATLVPGKEVCSEIVFTPDSRRVAFLINGYELRVYDSTTLSPAGAVKLIEPEGNPTSRIARGVTFSENGRAVTFDDCPRRHSGCRAGLAGVPQ